MSLSKLLVGLQFAAGATASNWDHVSLPGLDEKPHLQHLSRDDLDLDSFFDVKDKHFEKKSPIDIGVLEEYFDLNHPNPELKPKIHRHSHPLVQSSASYCGRAVDRLKAGPVNIPDLMCKNEKYLDPEFNGTKQIYWDDYHQSSAYSTYDNYLASGTYYFRDWDTVYTSANILDPDGSIGVEEPRQGGAGTCYLIASLGSMGEFPQLVKDMFVTKEKNDAEAIAVRFYIRGKPWVLTVNEQMLFQYSNPRLVFTQPPTDEKSMWGPIIEKAWAKMKGNYLISEGGFVENGFHYLVGIPAFRYDTADITTTAEAETAFANIQITDAANYLIAAGTAGSGNDQLTNPCGIAQSHAYSIVAAFEMVDAARTTHKCLLVRNPWGTANYNQEWSKDDTNWTNDLVAQVPFGIDVRTQQASDGYFVVPISKLIGTDCFADYSIGHYRAGEGYTDKWYDKENNNANGVEVAQYYFDRDQNVASDMYFTVETYTSKIIPKECTTGTIASSGQSVNYPLAKLEVFDASTNNRFEYQYYLEQFHRPIMVPALTARDVSTFKIQVTYEFMGSPHPDYTVKVYSKHDRPLKDSSGNTNMVHMDGQQPSGFTNSQFKGMDNWSCDSGSTDDGGKRDVSKIEVKSLSDVFSQSKSVEEFFSFIWYNPHVCFVWFHWW